MSTEPAEMAGEINELNSRIAKLEQALRFCRDLADEELGFVKVGTGAEVALRHISRKARENLPND